MKEVSLQEITIAIKKIKFGKASGLSEVSMEIINASGKVGIDVMMKLCQRVLDGKAMLKDWKTSVMVPIYKEKGDVINCCAYKEVKLLKHGMKIAKRVLEKRIGALVEVDDMQLNFMPGRRMTDALFIVKRMPKKYMEKDKKLHICLVNLEKAFDRFPKRVIQWALRKKELPEILVKAVMSLYEGSRQRLKLDLNSQNNFT